MGSLKAAWQNWPMQLVGGIGFAVIAVLPWLWIGGEDKAILPPANDDAMGLIVVFSLTALLGSWCVRRIGRGRAGFAVVTAVGMFLGMAGLGAQWLYATNPAAFSGHFSKASVHQVWVFSVALVISQTWYFLSAKLRLPIAALFYATLTISVSYWLQTVASLINSAQPFYNYLWYAGPLLLGLFLGFVGFSRAINLVFWVLALAIQWMIPAIIESAARVIQSNVRFGKGISEFGKAFSDAIVQVPWQTSLVVSLAVALLASAIIPIVRAARR